MPGDKTDMFYLLWMFFFALLLLAQTTYFWKCTDATYFLILMQFWFLINCHSHSQGKDKAFQDSSKCLKICVFIFVMWTQTRFTKMEDIYMSGEGLYRMEDKTSKCRTIRRNARRMATPAQEYQGFHLFYEIVLHFLIFSLLEAHIWQLNLDQNVQNKIKK